MKTENTTKSSSKNGIANFLHSIQFKIVLLVVLSLLITIVVTLQIIVPRSQAELTESTENNLLDLATLSTSVVDGSVYVSNLSGGDGSVTTELLTSLLQNVKLRGCDSSYAYIVDTDGVFLYSPRTEKIGTKVLNDYILNLLTQIPTGSYEPNGIFHYTDENGVTKYAAYSVSTLNQWTTVVLANEDELMANLTNIQKLAGIVATIILIIAALISFFIALSITNPLVRLTAIMKRIGALDFRSSTELDHFSVRKDETGQISRATKDMLAALHQMVESMQKISKDLQTNSESLTTSAEIITEACNDNSATSQELAAIMEETAATTENINDSIENIKNNTSQINDRSSESLDLSKEIKVRAEDLHRSSIASQDESSNIYRKIKEESSIALEQSKSVKKINVLANTIDEISDQTSLLSLNASIEAARAGEFGRGFSVVSTDIGKLASESADTAKEITSIVNEIQTSVNNMGSCLTTILDFLDTKVSKDYNSFVKSGEQYNNDAHSVEDSATTIRGMSNELADHSNAISQAVADITKTIGEAAIGVTDIAQKTTDVVGSVAEVTNTIQNTKEYADALKNMVEQFQL